MCGERDDQKCLIEISPAMMAKGVAELREWLGVGRDDLSLLDDVAKQTVYKILKVVLGDRRVSHVVDKSSDVHV